MARHCTIHNQATALLLGSSRMSHNPDVNPLQQRSEYGSSAPAASPRLILIVWGANVFVLAVLQGIRRKGVHVLHSGHISSRGRASRNATLADGARGHAGRGCSRSRRSYVLGGVLNRALPQSNHRARRTLYTVNSPVLVVHQVFNRLLGRPPPAELFPGLCARSGGLARCLVVVAAVGLGFSLSADHCLVIEGSGGPFSSSPRGSRAALHVTATPRSARRRAERLPRRSLG